MMCSKELQSEDMEPGQEKVDGRYDDEDQSNGGGNVALRGESRCCAAVAVSVEPMLAGEHKRNHKAHQNTPNVVAEQLDE